MTENINRPAENDEEDGLIEISPGVYTYDDTSKIILDRELIEKMTQINPQSEYTQAIWDLYYRQRDQEDK